MPTFAAMAADKQTALVLDDDSVAHGEPVHFGNFPGLWVVGQPVAVSELGFESEDEALARVEELGLPLKTLTVTAGSSPMPARANHLPGLDEVRGSDWKPEPGQPGAELQPGEVFPPDPFRPAELDLAILTMLDGSAADAVSAIEAFDGTAADLDALYAEEKARKNRSSVLAAIDARVSGHAADAEASAEVAETAEGSALGGTV